MGKKPWDYGPYQSVDFKGRRPKDLWCVTEWLQRPDGSNLLVLVSNARVQFRRLLLLESH